MVWPVPFAGSLHAAGWQPGSTVVLRDVTGRVAMRGKADRHGQVHFVPGATAWGTYVLEGLDRSGIVRRKEVVGGGD